MQSSYSAKANPAEDGEDYEGEEEQTLYSDDSNVNVAELKLPTVPIVFSEQAASGEENMEEMYKS